jgi:hypothetical protein
MITANPVVVRSEAWALSAITLDRGFEIRLGRGYLSLVFLCCVVLCMYRPCEELITRPGSPTVWSKKLITKSN